MDNAVKSVPPQYEVGSTVTYTCDQCNTGGGTSTCECNREWSPVEECYCKSNISNCSNVYVAICDREMVCLS